MKNIRLPTNQFFSAIQLKYRDRFLFTLLFNFLGIVQCLAQPTTPTITIPKEGVVLTSRNAVDYARILPQTLKEVVEDELIQISLAEQKEPLKDPVIYDKKIPLNPNGLFTAPPPYMAPVLFKVEDLSPKSADKISAQKILWNTQSIFWQHKMLNGSFTLSHADLKGSFSVEGSFARAYPFSFTPESDQIFRERISVTKPPALAGYSWITFRLFSANEDFVWIVSPLLPKPRQVTGSNRSDNYLLSLFSTEDLFGWSGRVDTVDATLTAAEILAAPLHIEERSSISGGNFKHISFKDPLANDTSTPLKIFTPFIRRPTYQLELITKDPYSTYGKQILVIDSKFFLPYYKIVFDRNGNPWKHLIMIYSISPDEAATPLPKGIVAIDLKQKVHSYLEYTDWELHQEYSKEISLKDFDPYALADTLAPKKADKKPNEKQK